MYKEKSADVSIYDSMLKKLEESIKDYGITPEQKGELVTKTVMTLIPQYEQLAETSARDLMTLEAELPIKASQDKEVIRKTQYYDDKMLEEVMGKQGDLASFATNANSDTAQATINDLKAKMANLEARVVPVQGNDCPAPTPVIPIPAGLNVIVDSDSQVTVSWLAVPNVTSYVLYQDGVQVASSGNLSYVATDLLELTKYSFNIKALEGSLSSDLSDTVVATTLATVP